MKYKTKIIDKFVTSYYIPIICTPRGNSVSRRELNPVLSEAEAWEKIDADLKTEPEGVWGEIEFVESKHIKVVLRDESGIIVPDNQGIVKQ